MGGRVFKIVVCNVQISKYRGRQHFSVFRGVGGRVGLGFWVSLGFGAGRDCLTIVRSCGSGFSADKKNPSWLDWDFLVLVGG